MKQTVSDVKVAALELHLGMNGVTTEKGFVIWT
jgi:hypothetical protein